MNRYTSDSDAYPVRGQSSTDRCMEGSGDQITSKSVSRSPRESCDTRSIQKRLSQKKQYNPNQKLKRARGKKEEEGGGGGGGGGGEGGGEGRRETATTRIGQDQDIDFFEPWKLYAMLHQHAAKRSILAPRCCRSLCS